MAHSVRLWLEYRPEKRKTVQRPRLCSVVYDTVHYREPLIYPSIISGATGLPPSPRSGFGKQNSDQIFRPKYALKYVIEGLRFQKFAGSMPPPL